MIRVLLSPVFWIQSIKSFRFFIHNNVLAIPKLAGVGPGTTISPSASLAFPENITLGSDCLINHNNRLYAGPDSKIVLSDGVMLGPDVFLTADHFSRSMTDCATAHSGSAADIVLAKNVRVGAHSVILPGVHVGENSTIGAGSVVTRDIPANVIAAGNPAVVIKEQDRVGAAVSF
jgi:acetyltransferase-like isoleucine patch superfamily enzyme